ncbi:DUF3300 domain-containing protein [Taibaiella soli]|uniref:DUF3300 domain-containing protein n=1 Tax=Taibaiella soli TaxID=1649169 RepID=UPI001401E567|nr:DUF3300 domain-containing protein [Taibaiella soli]
MKTHHMANLKSTLLLLLCILISSEIFAQWPKDIPLKNGGKLTIYQPTGEDLKGDVLKGRTAISIRKDANSEPVFGAMWFDAYVQIDKAKRMATLTGAKVTNAKFADSVSADNLKKLSDLIAAEVPKWDLQYPLDELLTSINEEKELNDPDLKTDPPKIYYATKATSLVIIDGEPKVQQDKDMKMDRVVNTPFLIVKDPKDGKFYLYNSGFWYKASSPTGSYEYVKNLPSTIKDLDKVVKENEQKNKTDTKAEDKPQNPTAIIVSTVPAELVQTEGEATYSVIEGTSLLFANNTLDDIFKNTGDQKTYILISGRWYSAAGLNGPWTYVPSDKLPADFARIPKGTEKDGVLASVAGTDEAKDAKMEAQIPQTAKVDRKKATCTVTYDGKPKFSKIENTDLELAENSSITVIKSGKKYYAVQNAVWFVSDKPDGPWKVSDDRPADVDKIPASCSAYNTKYVYVYDSEPDCVYMGYTPGYMGCYVYGPTVVYGTGWYYPPWYGAVYYPRPVTFGFGFSYNPWTGWNMSWGMSFNFGWCRVSVGFGGYGAWFGPPMFYPPYRHWGYAGGFYGPRPMPYGARPNVIVNRPVNINGDININGGNRDRVYNNNGTGNIYNRQNGVNTNDVRRGEHTRPGAGGGGTASQLPANGTRPGGGGGTASQLPANGTRPGAGGGGTASQLPANGTRPGAGGGGTASQLPANGTGGAARPSTQPANNVTTDRNGNVYQRDNSGNWQQRNNGSWQPTNQQNTQQLNRQNTNQQRGMERSNNFQNHGGYQGGGGGRSMPSGGGGGRMGGGGGGGRMGGGRR